VRMKRIAMSLRKIVGLLWVCRLLGNKLLNIENVGRADNAVVIQFRAVGIA